MPDWSSTRALFPALQGCTYLNTATFGQLSTRSVEAIARHFARRDERASDDFLSWFDDHDQLREKLARLINATADDIAFIPNASSGLGILMNGIDWRQGDEVVTLRGEFPNQIYAPAHRQLIIREAEPETLIETITAQTKLVAISSVNYTTGYRVPLAPLADACRRHGALLYLDATQGLGALRLDFAALPPCMVTVNCYKWMLAPNGAAFMAIHPELRQQIAPLTIGWRSHFEWRNVDRLHLGRPELKASAEKYEGGMLPSALLYALESSVDLLFELGTDAVEQRVLTLASQTRTALADLGAEVLPYEDSAIVSAAFPGTDASVLAQRLKAERVLVSARHGRLRVSTHFYNDESEIDRLCAAIVRLR